MAFLMMTMPACGFQSSSVSATDASETSPAIDARPSDAVISDGVPAPDATALCFGTYPTVCFASTSELPKAAVTLNATIDTDSTTDCDQHSDQRTAYCVVAGAGIVSRVGSITRATGSKPLVLLSTTTVDLAGTIDVSSKLVAGVPQNGAGVGAAIASCTTGAVAPTSNSGGYGGSFGGRGGLGQRQDALQTQTPPTAPPPIDFPPKLRAGCPGASGSTGASVAPGAGGAGGGAISVIATRINLSGTINASGSGGFGGPTEKAGGGGGGSGGMIVLDAPSIVASGIFALFANGGGGGQGGAHNATAAGQNGVESAAPAAPGPGGLGPTVGGAGGAGSAGPSKDGSNASQANLGGDSGGGAGGGGAGFIRAPGVTINVSPPTTN